MADLGFAMFFSPSLDVFAVKSTLGLLLLLHMLDAAALSGGWKRASATSLGLTKHRLFVDPHRGPLAQTLARVCPAGTHHRGTEHGGVFWPKQGRVLRGGSTLLAVLGVFFEVRVQSVGPHEVLVRRRVRWLSLSTAATLLVGMAGWFYVQTAADFAAMGPGDSVRIDLLLPIFLVVWLGYMFWGVRTQAREARRIERGLLDALAPLE